MLTGEVDIVLNKIAKAVACDLNAVAPVTDDGFAYWLKKNRLIRAMEEVEGDPLVSPDEVPSRIRMYTEPVSAKERGEYVFQFGHGIDNEMLNVTRLRTGLDKLDKAMGGGFGKGEGTLLMGTTGGGKTTVTCQLAARFVLDGAFGLFITTEQGHAELEPRIVSNYCNVPFDLIKDKVDIAVFNHDQKVKYDILREKLRPLYFAEWKMDRGKSVQDDLESEIVTYAEKHGRIDFVIMDWIGGALGSSSKGRDQEIRHIFQSTADKLWSIADKHRVASIATAQLNPKQAINKSAPDHTMLSECKTMGNNACYIIGITSLFAKIEDNKQNNDQPPGWSDKQFLYVCKGRKSQGGAVPFKRRYDYQRLENC
jgi:archaellum biogenesis ATPase FlaH